jgi:hypothetical protein
MLLLLINAFWLLILLLVVSLCIAARDGILGPSVDEAGAELGLPSSARGACARKDCGHQQGTPDKESRNDMHGHAPPVERTIRLWIAQQQHDRRKQEKQARGMSTGSGEKTHGAASTARTPS